MACSFGFEAEKYDISVKIGERVLLPAVRAAAADTLIITDGFSCYQQIEGLTGRKALHIAEVLRMGLRDGAAGPQAEQNSPQIYADVRR
jgi:Fe-S oxidoreductase